MKKEKNLLIFGHMLGSVFVTLDFSRYKVIRTRMVHAVLRIRTLLALT